MSAARWDWACALFHREHREHREQREKSLAAQRVICSRWNAEGVPGGVASAGTGGPGASWGWVNDMAARWASGGGCSRWSSDREQQDAPTGNKTLHAAQGFAEIVPGVPGVPGRFFGMAKQGVDPFAVFDDALNGARLFEEELAHMAALPAAWADQALRIVRAPTPAGRDQADWRDDVDAALIFAESHGQRANRLGWAFRDLLTGSPSVASLLRLGAAVTQVRGEAIVVTLNGERRTVSRHQGSARVR